MLVVSIILSSLLVAIVTLCVILMVWAAICADYYFNVKFVERLLKVVNVLCALIVLLTVALLVVIVIYEECH